MASDLMAAAGKPLDPWQCDGMDLMMAVRADRKWACFEYAEWVARQNGKGGLGEARVLTGFFVLGEELIMWSAHEYKTAMEAFRRVRALIRALGNPISETLVEVDGFAVKISNTNGEEGFERLDTGQRIKFVARSKSSGRGFSGDVNIIDESFAYTTDQQDALMPTLIARPNPQIIYLSSPPLTGDTGDVMFALKKRAEAGGDASLGYRDWGIEGNLEELKKIDLDDRRLWAAANPALGGGRVTEETIGRLRKSMTANEGRGFAREVLGVWPKRIEGGGAIDPALWASLCDPESRRSGDVAIGVDIAPDRKYAAMGIYGLREDGLGHEQVVLYKPGTEWILDAIVEWRNALNPVAVAMGRGTAASLEVELEKLGITRPQPKDGEPPKHGEPPKPQRGDLAVANATEMSAATGQFLDAVRQKTDRWAPDAAGALTTSVAGAVAKQTGDSLVWARKESDADTSPLVSVTLARWAFHALAHLVDEEDGPPNIW
jgi:phage terminase large subunit-like protein